MMWLSVEVIRLCLEILWFCKMKVSFQLIMTFHISFASLISAGLYFELWFVTIMHFSFIASYTATAFVKNFSPIKSK